jgi:hypothetical protein
MNMEKEYIKLILGLSSSKRTNKDLSLFGLAKITELKSYLNEIEKGKISQDR